MLNQARASLGVEYRPAAQLPPETDRWWHGTLGLAQFGQDIAPPALARVPLAAVPLESLNGPGALYEIWRADGPMHAGRCGQVAYRATAQLLFGGITVAADADLKGQTTAAYAQIFRTLEATGYRQLVRIWNYVSDIGQQAAAGERYWIFNHARHDSFIAAGRPVTAGVPAASALGTPRGSPLVIYFLAQRSAVQLLENPRQVSAYRYPAQYGPRSPTFSRAALLVEGQGTLVVSGTASIVGHETLHSDDAAAQAREALVNVGVLAEDASRRLTSRRFALGVLAYKVYVRHEGDLPEVMKVMREVVGPAARVVYFRADICRPDLLVEIEAVGTAQALATESRPAQFAFARG